MIDFDIENELREDLAKSEKLLWTGKPKRGIIFRPSDLFLVPFSFLWAGFALNWELVAIQNNMSFLLIIYGIPFIAVGAYISIIRFFVDARRRKHTVYGITSERILIKNSVSKKNIQSININSLLNLTFIEKSDLSGTIRFNQNNVGSSFTEGMQWPGIKGVRGLEFIENVKVVYDKLIQIQQQS